MWKEEGMQDGPWLLRRLDTDTSGVVALVSSERSWSFLVRQFEEHSIVKRYLAVVCRGAPEWARPRAPFKVTRRQDGRNEAQVELSLAFYTLAYGENTL